MKKKKLLIGIMSFIILGGMIAAGIFFQNESQREKKFAYSTPPPTQPFMKASTEKNAGKKKLSFPAFHISLEVPADLKTNKEVDPQSENTLIGSNFIALYSPDTVIDKKTHTQTAGVKLSIKLLKTKKGLSDKKDIVPTESIENMVEDDSIIPLNNPLLKSHNVRVYVFPLDESNTVWAYNGEALLKKNGETIDLTLFCVDYSYDVNNSTCQNLLGKILPTIK